MKLLTSEEIDVGLNGLEGWTRGERCIEKTYTFKSFVRLMLFVNAVGFVSESMNHHPDIHVHYNVLTLKNWTHVSGGVTERDFELARRIDALEMR